MKTLLLSNQGLMAYVEMPSSFPFSRTLTIHSNHINDICVDPLQNFSLLLSVNGVFPFCFYLLTAENMTLVYSHNKWGGKLILLELRLFSLL